MQLRILGCFGGSAPEMRPTSFLINRNIAIDAGALTSGLPISEQEKVSHIFFTHAHIDHLCGLPFLLDNVFSKVKTPIAIYGPEDTMDCLKSHLFNNRLWPDFTSISNDRSTILHLNTMRPFDTKEAGGLKITPVPMDHTVDCYGYLLEDQEVSIFIFGDTCSVDRALPLLEKEKKLGAVILEASFPKRMKKIAELSRHLTTDHFKKEALKLPKGVRILATHMKPDCLGEIQLEIADLALDNVSIIEQGAVYEFRQPTNGGYP